MAEKRLKLQKMKGKRTSGFLSRIKTHSGKKLIKRRRLRGRKRI